MVTPAAILLSEHSSLIESWLPAVSPILVDGLLPVALLVAMVSGFYLLLKRRVGATNNEAIQAVFVIAVTAFAVLTATGVWFRGKGMALTWPW